MTIAPVAIGVVAEAETSSLSTMSFDMYAGDVTTRTYVCPQAFDDVAHRVDLGSRRSRQRSEGLSE